MKYLILLFLLLLAGCFARIETPYYYSAPICYRTVNYVENYYYHYYSDCLEWRYCEHEGCDLCVEWWDGSLDWCW